MPTEKNIDYRHELIRKTIHLGSLSVPIVYYYLSRETMLMLIIPVVILVVGMDAIRHYNKPFSKFYNKTLGLILRSHERDGNKALLNGGSYVALSALMCILLFPKLIALAVFSVLIISDTSAALIGRRFGKHPFFHKTMEGSFAFFISGLIVIAIVPKVGILPLEYIIGAVAVAVGTVVEAASIELRLDDNFSMPLSMGITMWGGYLAAAWISPAQYGWLGTALTIAG